MSNRAHDEATHEVKAEMTPMIDVTFLLLIFFLCSIKFKVLEGKLQTYLPKDRGVAPDVSRMLSPLELTIDRSESGALLLALGGARVGGLAALGAALEDLRQRLPAPADQGPDSLRLKIDASDDALYEDVVAVVDRVLHARIPDVVFTGERTR